MLRKAILLAVSFAAFPLIAAAAPFFSYAPDYRSPFPVATGGFVEQEYLPLNDRLSAVSFWLSNGQLPGDVRFTLLSPSGSTIATRTVALPAIADAAGAETLVTLPAQVSVNGALPHRVRIEPLAVPLHVWRAGTGGLLAGSSGFPASKYGNAVVDGEQQPWSFAYALTEAPESGAPALSAVSVSQALIGQTRLVFTANEPVTYTVSYGNRSIPWTAPPEPCVALHTPCEALLSVTPGTAYAYSLRVRDAWGNESAASGTFTAAGVGPADTAAPGASPTPPASATPTPTVSPGASTPPGTDDGTPPVITDPRLIALTPTTATFAWSTDEAATSWVVILVRPELFAYTGTLDNTLELEHYLTLSGLPPDAYLRGRITSADAFGNASVVLIDFRTPLQETPVPTVTVSSAESPGVSAAPSGSAAPTGSVVPGTSPSPSYSVVASPEPSTSGTPGQSPVPSSSAPPSVSPTAVSPTPTPVVAYTDDAGNGAVTWEAAPGCDDAYGYRIDVFGPENELLATLRADCDTTTLALPAGTVRGSRVIVYADHGGAYEKIGPEAFVGEPPPVAASRRFVWVTLGAVVFLAVLCGAWFRYRRRHPVIPSSGVPPDAPFMGAAARR